MKMLTKQEREEIAKRFKSCTKVDFSDIYRGLFGIPTPKETTIGEDDKAVLNRLIELCDTSNMMELPLDKDGEVIHIGDAVWYGGEACQVLSIRYDGAGLFDTEVYIRSDADIFRAFWRKPNSVTNRELVTIDSLIERIKNALDNFDDTTLLSYDKLSRISNELESLGDGND